MRTDRLTILAVTRWSFGCVEVGDPVTYARGALLDERGDVVPAHSGSVMHALNVFLGIQRSA